MDTYDRRRADVLIDHRFDNMEAELGRLSAKLDRLEGRINVLFGALAVLSTIGTLLGPITWRWLEGLI